jgi:hypothetical protein
VGPEGRWLHFGLNLVRRGRHRAPLLMRDATEPDRGRPRRPHVRGRGAGRPPQAHRDDRAAPTAYMPSP